MDYESPETVLGPDRAAALKRAISRWYARSARDLPWRRTCDPYAIWVSETMLQQTRVETVRPYWERFMREVPTVHALAEAPEERVLALWSGLGYYRRARMLHAASKRVVQEHGGRLPNDLRALRRLEGVGAYTAGAVASIAFKARVPTVDGNVARVLSRICAIEQDVKSRAGAARVWEVAAQLAAQGDDDPGDWNQALMELGATVCAPRDAKCAECPARDLCEALARGIVGRLPLTASKRPPLAIRRVSIVLASRGVALLARRRQDALFGGLWEPPSAEGTIGSLASRLEIDARRLERVGEVVHVLSHRRMRIAVARGDLGRRRSWPVPGDEYDAVEAVALQELGARAHSTLARKVLAVAKVAASGLRSGMK